MNISFPGFQSSREAGTIVTTAKHTASPSPQPDFIHSTRDAELQRQPIPSAAKIACREKKLGQTTHPLGVATYQSKEATGPPDGYTAPFPPLESVNRPTVPTEQAGYYLDRRPQTMRIWALKEHPIRPLRINGRLAWPVAELRRLLGVSK